MTLIVNDYKGVLGHLKGGGEKVCPRLMDRFFMPAFYKFLDVFYQRHCKKRLKEALLKDEVPLFKNIEIETINRCNGSCSFCPVNKKEDQRPFQLMEEALFFRIIDQLAEMNYIGSVAFYSNNEPLLDKRIEHFAEYARDKLPNAILYMDTNGTLLSRERFYRLMQSLNYMTIDNYQDDLKFIPKVQELLPEIESPEYRDRVYVCLRKQNEMLNNRGGLSGNRTYNQCKIVSGCVFPFEQMVVRPDGKISLCCNDATGEITLGDLSVDSIQDVWRGQAFQSIRHKMVNGRQTIEKCRHCDTLVPYVFSATPMVKGSFKTMILGYRYQDRNLG